MKVKFIISLLMSLLLVITVNNIAFSGLLDNINKPDNKPPAENISNKSFNYDYSGAGPESSFHVSIPATWKLVYAAEPSDEVMYVIFTPPVLIPQEVICITIEPEPAMDTFEKYEEMTQCPLYMLDSSYLEYVKDLRAEEYEDLFVKTTLWHIKKGWNIEGIPADAKFNKFIGTPGTALNSVYIKDGVAFSVTGFGTLKQEDALHKTFAFIDESFKPGVPPEYIANNGDTQNTVSSNGNTSENLNNNENIPENNNTEVSYSGTNESTAPYLMITEPSDLEEMRNLTLEYEGSKVHIEGIASDESGVAQILINGQEAPLSSVSDENISYVTEEMNKPVEFKLDILLALGENEVEIVAVDTGGNRVTRNYVINREEASEIPVSPELQGEKWAVVIGISKYANPGINPLKYTDEDAREVYNYLISEGGYAEDHVKLLLDEEATTVNIKDALGVFLRNKAIKEDMVFIYFAGHGAPEADPASSDSDGIEKYMVTYDTNPESLYSTAIPMSEIATIFGRIYAEQIVFFIDSCYSGASGGRTFATEDGRAMNISDGFLTELSGKGRLIITASDANEISLEKDELCHGVFTYYLLEALRGGGDTNGDGYVTVDEAYNYLYESVARGSDNRQHPVKKGESQGQIVVGNTKSE